MKLIILSFSFLLLSGCDFVSNTKDEIKDFAHNPGDYAKSVVKNPKGKIDDFVDDEKEEMTPSLAGSDPENEELEEEIIDPSLFITTWNTENTGSSGGSQILLPLESAGTYDFTIDWGDGSTDEITEFDQAEVTHTYSTPGVYTLKISGVLTHFRFNDGGDAEKLIDLSQWGDVQWGDVTYMFSGCSNFNISASDTPDLSGVTNLTYMFNGAASFDQDISDWDLTSITNLTSMFRDATSFNNGDMPMDWGSGTRNVETMFAMFNGASSFNQDISGWDTSSIDTIFYMFTNASSFNNGLGSGVSGSWNWDIAGVSNLSYLFYGASSFNQDISSWDVSGVSSFNSTFRYAASYNNGGVSLSWGSGTAGMEYTGYMFNGASSFNQDISGWDVSTLTNMDQMFNGATSFNQDLSSWDFSISTGLGTCPSNSNYDNNATAWISGKPNFVGCP